MKKAKSIRLDAVAWAELKALQSLPANRIGASDIPPIREWTGFKRGILYRPIDRSQRDPSGRRVRNPR